MRAPQWFRRWTSSRARWEQQVADADTIATDAHRVAESLREQLTVARRRVKHHATWAAVAQQAATGHARTIGRARELLDKAAAGNTTVGEWEKTAEELRRVLDGWEPDRG